MRGTEGSDGVAALAAQWGVTCDAAQTEALLRYLELLMAWNARINLTGAGSVEDLLTDHLPDAFALAARLDRPEAAVDVGSGGGLPALPLAVLRPALEIVLCEPLAKKGAFLRTAIRELGLGGRVRLEARHAEALAAEGPGRFDVGFSRATLPPPAWLALGRRLVRPGGRIFVLTTPQTALDDLESAPVWSFVYGGGRRVLLEVVTRATDVPRET